MTYTCLLHLVLLVLLLSYIVCCHASFCARHDKLGACTSKSLSKLVLLKWYLRHVAFNLVYGHLDLHLFMVWCEHVTCACASKVCRRKNIMFSWGRILSVVPNRFACCICHVTALRWSLRPAKKDKVCATLLELCTGST
jgi:hypothetical protein